MCGSSSSWTSAQRWGVAASIWCFAFGLTSIYWAVGGDLGSNQLSPELQEQAERREAGFVAVLCITGVLKIVGGLVPLALAYSLWTAIPRKLLEILTWLGGIFLTLYGLGDIVSGTIRAVGDEGDNAIWYAVLWGPIWLLGGVLFIGSSWAYRRSIRQPESGASHVRRP